MSIATNVKYVRTNANVHLLLSDFNNASVQLPKLLYTFYASTFPRMSYKTTYILNKHCDQVNHEGFH